MPASYNDDRWGGMFFDTNLPQLVKNNLLDFKSLDKDVEFVSNEGMEKYLTSDAAVIYLPFCSTAFKGIYHCKDSLFEWFTVSFEVDTKKNILITATHRIPEQKMKEDLGKELYQEDKYSALSREMLRGTMESGPALKGALRIFDSIRNVDDVRMIKLTALRKHHPHFDQRRQWPCALGVSRGGYVGLSRDVI
jgi:hypothetical protein